MHIFLILILFLILPFASVGQDKFNGYYEPYIELGFDITENYALEFTVEERTILYDEESFKFKVQQIDLSHSSKLKLDDKNSFAVGIQYRFEENFIKSEENELRITEEYTYSFQPKATDFEFRIRAEQRLTSSAISHRFRYNFAASRSLKGQNIDRGEAYITGDLETLLTLAKAYLPEYEQRIGAGIGWAFSNFLKLEFVTEYRLADFTKNITHKLFFITGIKLTL